MENEKKNLHKHFYDRTLNMLKTIENMENNNIRNKIKQITEDAYRKLLQVKLKNKLKKFLLLFIIIIILGY